MKKTLRFKGKVAIVTGGTGGIGSVVAAHLAREGASVVILARKTRRIERVVREIKEMGGMAAGFSCDVANERAVARAAKGIYRKFHRIDILVNAAGVQAPIGPFSSNGMKEWKENLDVNLLGTVHMCGAVIPFMMKRRQGSIINFSGGGSTSLRPNFSAYSVAKIGVVKFSETLGAELASSGIRVNAISPGAVNTAMLTEVLRAGARAGKAELAESKKRAKQGGTPPALAAELIVFLASDASRGLTGRVVSAVWDDWRHWGKKEIKDIMASDRLTLRRIK